MSIFNFLLEESGAAIFDPATISNIEGRWRGDDFDAITDGTEISAWNDISGLSRTANAIAASPDRQTVKRNAIATNKTTVASNVKQGLRFNNGSTLFNLNTSDFSLFTVLKFKKLTGTEEDFWAYGSTTSQSELRFARDIATGKLLIVYNGVGGYLTTPSVPVYKFMCLMLVCASGVETFYINGSAVAWDTTPGGLNVNIQYLNLNAGFVSGTSYTFEGETAELIPYRKALSSTERSNLYSYALARYPDIGISAPVTVSRTFVSAGDTNGVLYFAGTVFGTISWINPHTLGYVTASASSTFLPTFGAPLSELCNRVSGHYCTQNTASSWIKFDLRAGNSLEVTGWTFQCRDDISNQQSPVQLLLEGSNNDSTWTTISNPTGLTWSTTGQFRSWTFAGSGVAYRYLRITQVGVNTSGSNYFIIGDVEFYGSFTYTY